MSETEPDIEPSRLSPAESFVGGLLMGGADAIPGVSGGTIALILGIYERFIGALATVLRAPRTLRSPEGRSEIGDALRFLVPLGVGLGLAYVLVTKLLVGGSKNPDALMTNPETAPFCYGFFFGLVLFSIKEPWSRVERRSPGVFVAVLLGFAASFTFAGLPYAQEEPETWMLLLGGAGAISVMLLPGVSGSLLLVMLGQYQAVVQAMHDLNLIRFGVFLLGIVLGLVLFVPTLRRLLRVAPDRTMAVLTGLMAGSLRALWPWKESFDPKQGRLLNLAPDHRWMWVMAAAAAGAGVVYLLSRLERR